MSFDSAASSSGECIATRQAFTNFNSCDSGTVFTGNTSDTASATALGKLPVVELDGSAEPHRSAEQFALAKGNSGVGVLPDFRDFPPPMPSVVRPDAAVIPKDGTIRPGAIAPAPMVGSFTAEQVRLVLADRDRALALHRGQQPRDLPEPGVSPIAPAPDRLFPGLPKPDGQHDPTDRRPSKVEFTDNFDNARQAALDSGRPLIISFSKPGCGACTQLDSQAWPNQTALVNDNAIRVKLNGSRNQELAQRYGVTAYPTTVVVNPRNMDVLQKARGAISSAELSGMLQDAFRKYRGG